MLRLGALGDVCLATPLVASLARSFPDAHIDWIIDQSNLPLVDGFEGCYFIAINKPRSLVDYLKLYKKFSSYSYDILLVIQSSFRVNCLSRCIRATHRYGFGRLHSRDGQWLFVNRYVRAKAEHLVDANMRFAEALGAKDTRVCWSLPVSSGAVSWVAEKLNSSLPCIVMVLTSSKVERDWPIDRYKVLIQRLAQAYQVQVVLTGGPSKREQLRADQLISALDGGSAIINWVGQTDVGIFKALIQYADVVISPDTSAVHVAVALDTPVIGLYAVAPMAKTGPYGVTQWCVDCFDLAVQSLLKKDPKKVSWRQRVHHKQAMTLITVDDVFKRCQQLFEEKQLT